MDCYIASLHRLINDDRVTASELSFMSNYSVTRAWIDTKMADSFDVPIIYPSWFPNFNALQELYPQLRTVQANDFKEYLSVIHERLARGSVVTAIDRYHLDYIKPRRHMGAHYIIIHDAFDTLFMYFDPYDRGEHVVSAEELEAWTSPSHPSVQYMGYSVTFIDPSVDSKRPPLTLETILDQRIANIRTTIRNIGGFKVTAPLSSRAYRFFLKLALGGMSNSDFNKKNGRLENKEFFIHKRMLISAALETAIIGYYQALLRAFEWIYIKGIEITRRRWIVFMNLYIIGLRIELSRYQALKAIVHGARIESRDRNFLEAMR